LCQNGERTPNVDEIVEHPVPEGRLEIARRFSAGSGSEKEQAPEGRLNRMSHTYVSVLLHCVFSTKGRCGLIPPTKQPDLWAYFGGIARKNGFKALAAGGTDNHVHLLLSLPATMPVAKAMQLLKGGSSKWMNDSGANSFAWQEGYGAFSVGISQQSGTISYFRSQAEHHHKREFEEEFLAFLKKHGIEYDPTYVWG